MGRYHKAEQVLKTIAATAGIFLASAAIAYAAVIIVPGGGTGAASFTSGGILRGNGTAPISAIAPGSNGQALIMSGGSPAWGDLPPSFDTAQANTWLGTKSTSDLLEGVNMYWTTARGTTLFASLLAGTTTDALTEGSTRLYYQDARARSALSETIIGIDYATSTGVFSTASGYGIPTTAKQTEWDSAYTNRITSATSPLSIASNVISLSTAGNWTGTLDSYEGSALLARANHTGTQLASTISDFSSTARGLFSSSATGLTYTSGTGVFSLTGGYTIPLTASTTAWDAAAASTTALTPSYIRGLFSASSPLSYNSSTGALTISVAGDWTGTFDGQQGSWYQDRANHTGTQLASTISDFNASVASYITGSSTLPSLLNYWTKSGTDLSYGSGNVGIGTTTPTSKLVVMGDAYLGGDNTARKLTIGGYPYAVQQLVFSGDLTTGSSQGIRADGNTGELRIKSNSYITLNPLSAEMVRITSSGVGIGTTTPAAKFAVAGNTYLGGNLTATGTVAVPALSDGCVEIASGILTSTGFNCGTGSGGITTLGGQTGSTQTFATTTSNGGWGFSSASNVHTLNIPTASASNPLGLLSSTDWSTFNGKESALTFTYPLLRSSNTISLAFGTTTSNTWGGTQTFTNTPVLGSLTGFVKAAAGVLSTAAINLASDITGTLGIGNGGTNITTYATGDIIYASATNTLSKRTIGTEGDVLSVVGGVPTWVATSTLGISSGSSGGIVDYQTFTSSGTWTKPAGLSGDELVRVWMWGGGGAGGNGYTGSGVNPTRGRGGGGGGGAFMQYEFKASQLGSTESVTVGAGGTTGGATGGQSAFATMTVEGGPGGGNGQQSNSPYHMGGGNGGSVLPGIAASTPAADFHAGALGGARSGGQSQGSAAVNFGGGGGGAGYTGGSAIWGGGGGAGTGDSGIWPGGTSKFAGAGGSNGQGSTLCTDGSAPAGGGGGSGNDSVVRPGCAGARGEVRIWVIK